MKKGKKAAIIIVAAVLVIALGFGIEYVLTPHEKEIDESFSGMLLFENGAETQKCTVELKGKYVTKAGEPPLFNGADGGVFIDGVKLGDFQMRFEEENCEYAALINGGLKQRIVMKDDCSVLFIRFPYDLEAKAPVKKDIATGKVPTDKGVMCLLVVPAENEEEAVNRLKEFSSAQGVYDDWKADINCKEYISELSE